MMGESKAEAVGLGVDAVGEAGVMTTCFSSENSELLVASLFPLLRLASATLARLPRVGTLLPELAFRTSMGRAVRLRATMELPVMLWGTCGTGGCDPIDAVSFEPVVAPDLTLTTAGLVRNACCAGTGDTTALR